eukprot:5302378-Pyramimonas_sp.AAC.1
MDAMGTTWGTLQALAETLTSLFGSATASSMAAAAFDTVLPPATRVESGEQTILTLAFQMRRYASPDAASRSQHPHIRTSL